MYTISGLLWILVQFIFGVSEEAIQIIIIQSLQTNNYSGEELEVIVRGRFTRKISSFDIEYQIQELVFNNIIEEHNNIYRLTRRGQEYLAEYILN